MEAEMSTDPDIAELWESDAGHGHDDADLLYLCVWQMTVGVGLLYVVTKYSHLYLSLPVCTLSVGVCLCVTDVCRCWSAVRRH